MTIVTTTLAAKIKKHLDTRTASFFSSIFKFLEMMKNENFGPVGQTSFVSCRSWQM